LFTIGESTRTIVAVSAGADKISRRVSQLGC
jgi:hypothetical protein